MAIWPTVPPAPPGTPTPGTRGILDRIREIAAVPDGADPGRYAEAVTDLQAVTATAHRELALTAARVQPPHGHRGILSLTELERLTGMSRNGVIGLIRHGRRVHAEDDLASREQA